MVKIGYAVGPEETKQFIENYRQFKKFLGEFFANITIKIKNKGGSLGDATVICYRILCWIFNDLSESLMESEKEIIRIMLEKQKEGG
ncbi:MAG: hypothetical protein DRJ03_11165 [Chloroflexi bacterium]|nr:MAG: hypothetical protein DRJ03_11165 [Chloroflexota bacterium]